jgi:hypothetical protein
LRWGECPFISWSYLADTLGCKPASLRVALRWLVDAWLILRVRQGVNATPQDFAQRIEDARELGQEPLRDRLQMQQHSRERCAYREAYGEKRQEPDAEEPELFPPEPEAGGGTQAGRENEEQSRRKRAEHLAKARQREGEGEPTEADEETRKRWRVWQLVREGMARRFAMEAVYGSEP